MSAILGTECRLNSKILLIQVRHIFPCYPENNLRMQVQITQEIMLKVVWRKRHDPLCDLCHNTITVLPTSRV